MFLELVNKIKIIGTFYTLHFIRKVSVQRVSELLTQKLHGPFHFGL